MGGLVHRFATPVLVVVAGAFAGIAGAIAWLSRKASA